MAKTQSQPLESWLLLHQTYALIYKRLDRLATKLGLSAAMSMPLLLLKDAGHSLRLSQLAGVLVQEAQSVTSLVDRLEGKGLVRREPDRRDRRAINLALTSKGAQVADKLRTAVAEMLAESLAPLSPRDLEAFTKCLTALRAHGADALDWNRRLFDGVTATTTP